MDMHIRRRLAEGLIISGEKRSLLRSRRILWPDRGWNAMSEYEIEDYITYERFIMNAIGCRRLVALHLLKFPAAK